MKSEDFYRLGGSVLVVGIVTRGKKPHRDQQAAKQHMMLPPLLPAA